MLIVWSKVADVLGPWDRRLPKGQGLLQKVEPPTFAILSQNLVLSQFTSFLKCFCQALNESHSAFIEVLSWKLGNTRSTNALRDYFAVADHYHPGLTLWPCPGKHLAKWPTLYSDWGTICKIWMTLVTWNVIEVLRNFLFKNNQASNIDGIVSHGCD